jgi:long-chain fatty acid transport protein
LKRALALAVFLAPGIARANPPDTYGFGSRETAMGNAAAAETGGFAANYYNPAAIARSHGLDVSAGYFVAAHSFEMNGRDSKVDPVRGFVGGLVLPADILGQHFAFGVAMHLPDEQLSRVRALKQDTPRWELYDTRNQRLYLAANIGYELWSRIWIGGGLAFMSSTTARLDITGSANIFAPDNSQLRHEVDADLTAVRYPQAGIRIKLSDDIALAAVYRGQFKLDLDLKARLAGDISGLTSALYDLESTSVNAFVPQQFVLGGSWAFGKRVRATFDWTWIEWSAYVSPTPRLQTTLDVPPPPGGWPGGITPPTAPAPITIVPLHLHDRVVPHLGLEWKALALADHAGFVRTGYEVAKSPFPAQSGVTSFVDRDRHTFSAGLGWAWRGVMLDAHVQVAVLPDATTRKANPADFTGDFTAGGHFINAGLTASYLFGERR